MPTKYLTGSVAFACLCSVVSAGTIEAQPTPIPVDIGSKALVLGERIEYGVKLGRLHLGRAFMAVEAVEDLGSTPVYRAALDVQIGAAMLRFEDRLISWIAPKPFRSLAFERRDSDAPGGRRRYEFDEDVLDEVAALYMMRRLPLEQGATYEFDHYFKADGNPISFRVVGRQKVRVPAGRFETIVIEPVIPALTVFRKEAGARLYVTDDDRRILVQIETRTKVGKLTLYMTEYEEGE